MSRILVVDDESSVLAAFEEILDGQGHDVVTARSADTALTLVKADVPDLVVMDVGLGAASGLQVFRTLKELHPKLPVIIMTGQGSMESAIEATKLGAFDYQLKPFDPQGMLDTIAKALSGSLLSQRHVELNPATVHVTRDAIIGQSPGIQGLFKAIGRVAPTDATVLIRGESGTGKELVARAIYQHSLRTAAPLLVVNCVAIPETLLESELFGYERGAFTGATSRRIGKFEQARGGTVFLDEIGDVPPSIQAKLLRVLQERSFERLGGNETIHADVRVLAATNRNLEEAIRRGSFREDLYYRLNVVNVQIPALRERRDDIPRLAVYFLERFSAELKIDRPILTEDAVEALSAHPWPGNVRELEHCIYRVLIFTAGYPIQAADISRALKRENEPSTHGLETADGSLLGLVQRYLDANSGPGAHERLLEDVDRLLIAEALRRTKGNQTHAARLLGLSRPTLHAKASRYGPSADTELSES